jgi:hypothetical protein
LPSASGMDNFHDSAIMASAQTQLPSVKFWHAIGGLYLCVFTVSRMFNLTLPVQLGVFHYP